MCAPKFGIDCNSTAAIWRTSISACSAALCYHRAMTNPTTKILLALLTLAMMTGAASAQRDGRRLIYASALIRTRSILTKIESIRRRRFVVVEIAEVAVPNYIETFVNEASIDHYCCFAVDDRLIDKLIIRRDA
jgi:hypothetical protein